MWMTPAYDPDTRTLYVTTGNPSPDLDGKIRPGDNLYTESMVAIDVTNGQMKWFLQMIPHDVWDLDATSPPILFERNGRKLVGHAGKTGWPGYRWLLLVAAVILAYLPISGVRLFLRRRSREAQRRGLRPDARGAAPDGESLGASSS